MIRAIAVVGGLAAVGFGGNYAYQEALTSPALSIQSVRLHQVPTMLIEPVRARVKAAYGQNLLALDLVELRESIEGLPVVRGASIRRVLPDGLVVSVEARVPRARVVSGDATHVIDRQGVVIDLFDRRVSLPEIRLAPRHALQTSPGRRVVDDPILGGALRSALAVIDWLDEAADTVSTPIAHLRIDDGGIVLVAVPATLEIVVGNESRLDAKMAAVRSLMAASPPTPPATIDARYTDMLVVRAMPADGG